MLGWRDWRTSLIAHLRGKSHPDYQIDWMALDWREMTDPVAFNKGH